MPWSLSCDECSDAPHGFFVKLDGCFVVAHEVRVLFKHVAQVGIEVRHDDQGVFDSLTLRFSGSSLPSFDVGIRGELTFP